jgi:hypothetical protein
MTSLETEDGSFFSIGSFSRNQLSEDGYKVDEVDGIWSEAVFINSSDDENVTSDDNSYLNDHLESAITVSDDSYDLIHTSPYEESCESNTVTEEFIYSIDDVYADHCSIPVKQEDANDSFVDVCTWSPYSSSRKSVRQDDGKHLPDFEDTVFCNPKSPWHKPEDHTAIEDGGTASEIALGDFQWTPVRVDENGYLHPVEPQLPKPVFIIDNAEDVIQLDEDALIDFTNNCNSIQGENCTIPTQIDPNSILVENLDDDADADADGDALEWLFHMKEQQRHKNFDDVAKSLCSGAIESCASLRAITNSGNDSVWGIKFRRC